MVAAQLVGTDSPVLADLRFRGGVGRKCEHFGAFLGAGHISAPGFPISLPWAACRQGASSGELPARQYLQ